VRDLAVRRGEHPRAQPHLSSASGLALAGRWLCVIADDEHHLGLFDSGDPTAPGRLLRLLPDDLPAGFKARKKAKPDFESLVQLPGASLLATGSGSRRKRQRGLLFAVDARGGLAEAPEPVDLAALYEPLQERFDDLNIEGGFVSQGRLCLLQRGNKGGSPNALITYKLRDFQQWLGRHADAPGATEIKEWPLGACDGVPLGFTDATTLPDGGWLFSAVAEDTTNSYVDGACAGSAIGWVDAAGQLVRLGAIEGSPKVEGIAIDAGGRLLAVTDADDPEQPSRLIALSPVSC
jgi:hypothetical protein